MDDFIGALTEVIHALDESEVVLKKPLLVSQWFGKVLWTPGLRNCARIIRIIIGSLGKVNCAEEGDLPRKRNAIECTCPPAKLLCPNPVYAHAGPRL